jgi:hypothetical protein
VDSGKPATDPGPSPEEGAGNIDKVRDILFSGQMRDTERRFAWLEERSRRTGRAQRRRAQAATARQFVKKEAESLADRIKAEHDGGPTRPGLLARGARERESVRRPAS